MLDQTLANPAQALALLLPGFVAHYIFGRLVPWVSRARTHVLIRFAAVTLNYFGVVELVLVASGSSILDAAAVEAWPRLIGIIAGAFAYGVVLAILIQADIFARLVMWIPGVRRSSYLPSAWDWKFQDNFKEAWVIVRLKDGAIYHGYCGRDSYVSSDPENRDILIEKVYDASGPGRWKDQGNTSVLIQGENIVAVEFIAV